MRVQLLLTATLLVSAHSSYTPEHVMVDITNEFGACVLKLVASRTENVAFSPYGLVSVALVLYEGANGPTAAEIHNTLRLPWDRQVTRIGFRDLHRYLKSYFSNDGFLRGLVLSKPNVLLNRNYTTQLQFYGFDLRTDTPTKPPPSPGTTSSPFTSATSKIPSTVRSTVPSTVRSTIQSTAGTMPPSTIRTTTSQKPEDTTMLSTIKEARETTKSDTTNAVTTTEKDVEGKDMDGPDVDVPNESTKTIPPTPEVTTAAMTTEAKVSEEQTNPPEVTETKPATTSPSPQAETTTVSATTVTTTVSAVPSTTATPTTTPPQVAPETEPPVATTSATTTTQEPTTTVSLAPVNPETTTQPPPPPTEQLTTPQPPPPNTEAAATPQSSVETTSKPETTQGTEGTTQIPAEAETDNIASESEMVTRKERALYPKGYVPEHREGIPNWVPQYQDPRWNYHAPLENWFFTPAGGERVPIITYTAYLPYAYIAELAALALQLPLDDPRYFMVVLLPEERDGLGKLLYALQWCPIRGIVNQLKTTAIYATIPAFTIVKHINLVPALTKMWPEDGALTSKALARGTRHEARDDVLYQQLGIVRVFDPLKADLTAMSPEPGLYVRTVEQVVTVSLRKYFANHRWFDATPGDVEQHFIANHPFAYFVFDRATQVTLMTGTIVNPVAHNQ